MWNIKEIKCKICGLVSEQDFNKFQVSNAAQKFLKIYLEDVFRILETETSLNLTEIKGNLKSESFKLRFYFFPILEIINTKWEFIETRFKNIEDSINCRVMFLCNQIFRLGIALNEKLKNSKEEFFK